MRIIFAFVLVALAVVGCATAPFQAYSGPRLPDSEHARISGDSEKEHTVWVGLDQRVYITRVDKQPTKTFLEAFYPETVFVHPGEHLLQVKYMHFGSYARGLLSLDAQVGKSYIVRRRLTDEGRKVVFWIEEADTGRRVGHVPAGNLYEIYND